MNRFWKQSYLNEFALGVVMHQINSLSLLAVIETLLRDVEWVLSLG